MAAYQQELLPALGVKPRRAKPFRLTALKEYEHDLQITCASAFDSGAILLPDVTWTAIDSAFSLNRTIGRNGKEIGWGEVQKRKKRGIKPGPPDFVFWHVGRGFAIELKTVEGELTEDEEKFLRSLIRSGIEVAVCWTFNQVIARLSIWGLLRPGVRVIA